MEAVAIRHNNSMQLRRRVRIKLELDIFLLRYRKQIARGCLEHVHSYTLKGFIILLNLQLRSDSVLSGFLFHTFARRRRLLLNTMRLNKHAHCGRAPSVVLLLLGYKCKP